MDRISVVALQRRPNLGKVNPHLTHSSLLTSTRNFQRGSSRDAERVRVPERSHTYLSLSSSSSHPLSLCAQEQTELPLYLRSVHTHTQEEKLRAIYAGLGAKEKRNNHTAGVRRINRPIISTYVCAIIESGINSRLLVSVRTRKTNGAECEGTAGLCVRQGVFRSLCALWCVPAHGICLYDESTGVLCL